MQAQHIISLALRANTPSKLIDDVCQLIGLCDENDFQMIDQLVIQINSMKLESEIANSLVTNLSSLDSAQAAYLNFKILTKQKCASRALEQLNRAIELSPVPSAVLLFARARITAKSNDFNSAILDAQQALKTYPNYSTYAKVDRLIGKLIQSDSFNPKRKFKLALLGSVTTSMLRSVLQASCFAANLQVEIYEGLFGSYKQEILDPGSRLYEFKPDVALIINTYRDLHLAPVDENFDACKQADQQRNLWQKLKQNSACHIIQTSIALPNFDSWSMLEDQLASGRRKNIQAYNLELSQVPQGVSWIDVSSLSADFGLVVDDETQWAKTKQFPAASSLPTFADIITAHCKAVFGLSSKVLALDLDNTLWGGVIGEDGIDGIHIGPDTPLGEGYSLLQTYAKELKQRGIVLVACSKNNFEDAIAPFKSRDDMVLKQEDFVAIVANWQDKASNLKQIAEDLSLGIDSFVFLDDNPLERAWIRAELPSVAVPECKKDPWDMLRALKRGMYFPAVQITNEDLRRHISYAATVAKKNIEKTGQSLDDFLNSLDMKSVHLPVCESSIVRATQLTNKTNQFNLTTKRYTQAQLELQMKSDNWWCHQFRLIDKFGDHGIIGLVFAEKGETWNIDTWLMSCRVLGRSMEKFMFQILCNAAKTAGAKRIVGSYIPTTKNSLVKDHYLNLGFEPTACDNEFVYDLAKHKDYNCEFISDENN